MKFFKKIFVIAFAAILMTACYTLEYAVGTGAKSGLQVTGKNHYVIEGLAQVGKKTTPANLAGETKDYNVKITHTFIDGLLMVLTLGIYTPTTMIVTK